MESRAVIEWETRLKRLFDEIDDTLEERFGSDYPRHPARPKRGATSSKEHDGLFNIGASFSAGFGSTYGRGYVIDVSMVTLSTIPAIERRRVEEMAIELLKQKLPRHFPGINLRVEQDGTVFKIVGDLFR